jgi:hypothetical protein
LTGGRQPLSFHRAQREQLRIARPGADRISIGSLTQDIEAVDLSMRFAGAAAITAE